MKKILTSSYFYFGIFLLILLFVFRSLFLNGFNKSLTSWGDYPYIIWVMNQNVEHIKDFDFTHFFESNIFYPYKNTLLLSDLLLPQSIIYLIISIFGFNLIANFNILLLLTFVLDYLSLFLFWKVFFKKNSLSFLGSIVFIFSPFFGQLGHFQMMSYWPMFFSLYFLVKDRFSFKWKNVLISGIFLAIQFLASVYLAIFLCFIAGFWFLFSFKKNDFKLILKSFLIYFLTFFVLDFVFINGYLKIKYDYGIERNLGEYILYSAHITDYIFPDNVSSFFYRNNFFIEKWKSFNYHVSGERACFPGILLSVLFLFGFFNLTKSGKRRSIGFELTRERCFFFLLILIGFFFSLGPRLNVNGVYAHIPLPSYLFLKFLPLFNTIRASARWSFLFYLGMIYFLLFFLKKIKNEKFFNVIILAVLFCFILEYLPISLTSFESNIKLDDYFSLGENCTNEDVLLEIPYTHLFGVDGGIGVGLSYITKVEFDSYLHKCHLVNGYSGYDIPEVIEFFQKSDGFVLNNQYDDFYNLLKSRNISYLKFNREIMSRDIVENYETFLKKLIELKKINMISTDVYKVN